MEIDKFSLINNFTKPLKKHLLILILAIVCVESYAQISFENGYYINNLDQKIECQIKNEDWKNNPSDFEYRIPGTNESLTEMIGNVKEFAIYNGSKHLRAMVNIDRSKDNAQDLTLERNPLFKTEELFLKVLTEGKASLYEYVDGNLKRYFYNVENSTIEQLIFKKFKLLDNKIGTNNQFKQQLWEDLKCSSLTLKDAERLSYKRNELIDFFEKYYECTNSEYVSYLPQESSDRFHLTLRPRISNSSLSMRSNPANNKETDFESKLGLGVGLEFEFILPFNKNKWSLILEPTYLSFVADKTRDDTKVSCGKLVAEVNYKSIEVPLGLRHYFFLNDNSKLFLNVSYVFDMAMNSSIELKRADGVVLDEFKINSSNYLALGAGYKLNDKYSVELRYFTSKTLLGDYVFWNSDYKTMSLIVGYTFL